MSAAMIMKYRELSPVREGLGDITSDVSQALLTPLSQAIDAKVTVARDQVLTEVKKQSNEAKIMAVAGGFVAGMLGAFLYNRFVR